MHAHSPGTTQLKNITCTVIRSGMRLPKKKERNLAGTVKEHSVSMNAAETELMQKGLR